MNHIERRARELAAYRAAIEPVEPDSILEATEKAPEEPSVPDASHVMPQSRVQPGQYSGYRSNRQTDDVQERARSASPVLRPTLTAPLENARYKALLFGVIRNTLNDSSSKSSPKADECANADKSVENFQSNRPSPSSSVRDYADEAPSVYVEYECELCGEKHRKKHTSTSRNPRCPFRCPHNEFRKDDHMIAVCSSVCEHPACLEKCGKGEIDHWSVECVVQCAICGQIGDKGPQAGHCGLECELRVCPCFQYGHWGKHCTTKCYFPRCKKLRCDEHCVICGQRGRAGLNGHPKAWNHSWGEHETQFFCLKCDTSYWAGYACKCENTGIMASADQAFEFSKRHPLRGRRKE